MGALGGPGPTGRFGPRGPARARQGRPAAGARLHRQRRRPGRRNGRRVRSGPTLGDGRLGPLPGRPNDGTTANTDPTRRCRDRPNECAATADSSCRWPDRSARCSGCAATSLSADGHVVDKQYGCGAHSDTPAPAGTGSPIYEPYDDGVLDVMEKPAVATPAAEEPATEEPHAEEADTEAPVTKSRSPKSRLPKRRPPKSRHSPPTRRSRPQL